MVTLSQVHEYGLALPAVELDAEGDALTAPNKAGKRKGIAWQWRQRVDPKKRRVLNPGVIVFQLENVQMVEMLLAEDPLELKYQRDPHYDGYPVVLVKLNSIDLDELQDLLNEAHRVVSSKR